MAKGTYLLALFALTAPSIPAQTFTTLFGFYGKDGANPTTGVVQGIDGDLHGTTPMGGAGRRGTVFSITPSGPQLSYSFCAAANCADGAHPNAGLVPDLSGNLYGTTGRGGLFQFGTVFKISPGGKLATLYSFCAQAGCTDGKYPSAGLIRSPGGEFYGTTQNGGANGPGGTIFKINPNGTFTTIYSFCAQAACQDGWDPSVLTLAQNGDLYGVTAYGGAGTRGTVFRITPAGALTTLHSFCTRVECPDGSYPVGPLVQASDGNFYGTTATGGAFMDGGTFFRITPAGTLTTLYNFCAQAGCTDGLFPGSVIQATDGNFYGTTIQGGFTVLNKKGEGTLFRISPSGLLTTLYTFCTVSCSTDGAFPGPLLQRTDGDFYGTTEYGGAGNAGTVFRLSTGLGPFVRPQPAAAKTGALVEILGTNLTGATSVTFNGVPAVFKAAASSLITAIVPAAATSGKIEVVTPTGTLMSNVNFEVIP